MQTRSNTNVKKKIVLTIVSKSYVGTPFSASKPGFLKNAQKLISLIFSDLTKKI